MKESQEEAERDIMEEALILLNESHNYWVNGDLEDAWRCWIRLMPSSSIPMEIRISPGRRMISAS